MGIGWPTNAVCHASGVDQFNFVVSVDKDTLDFFASVIRSVLSWPVAFLAAVVIFYKPLKGLIERIRRLKIPGAEIDVPEQLLEADLSASDAGTERVAKPGGSSTEDTAPAVTPNPEQADPPNTEGESTAPRAHGRGEVARLDTSDLESMPRTQTMWRWLASYARDHDTESRSTQVYVDPNILLLDAWNQLNRAIEKVWAKTKSSDARSGSVTRVITLYGLGLVDQPFVDAYMRLHRLRVELLDKELSFSPTEAQAFSKTARRLQNVIETIEVDQTPQQGAD